MRFLFCADALGERMGGSITAIKYLSRELLRSGHVVEVATSDPEGCVNGEGWFSRVHSLGPRMRFYGYSRAFGKWVRDHAQDYDAVIINGLWRYQSQFGSRALRAAAKPYIVFAHGMIGQMASDPPGKRLRKRIFWSAVERKNIAGSAGVFYGTEHERRQSERAMGGTLARHAIVPLGIPAPPHEPGYVPSDGCSVLYLGRLHPCKNLGLLVHAVAELRQAGIDLRLTIAGPDQGGHRAHLAGLAKQRGVEKLVTFWGPAFGDSKWDLIRQSALCVLPSAYESFGLSAVEALACGVPVLLSENVGVASLTRDSGAALICAPELSHLTRALRDWTNMTQTARKRMSERALALYKELFTLEAYAKVFLRSVETLLREDGTCTRRSERELAALRQG
jgi:glycosyltransferase involved in cell wall biosynthesis